MWGQHVFWILFVLLMVVGMAANATPPKDNYNSAGAYSGSSSDSTVGNINQGSLESNVLIENPDDIKIRNTPDARAPFSNSTGPCIVGFSAGLSLPGFGGSLGKGIEDQECTRRQSAQTWSNMGLPAMAIWLMCRSKDMERTGIAPEDCDAMVAQLQIEARLDATPDRGDAIRCRMPRT